MIRKVKQDAQTHFYFYGVNNKNKIVGSWISTETQLTSRINWYSSNRKKPDSIILIAGNQVFTALTDTLGGLQFYNQPIAYTKRNIKVPTVKHQAALRGLRYLDPWSKLPEKNFSPDSIIGWLPIRTLMKADQQKLTNKKPN